MMDLNRSFELSFPRELCIINTRLVIALMTRNDAKVLLVCNMLVLTIIHPAFLFQTKRGFTLHVQYQSKVLTGTVYLGRGHVQ